MSVCAALPPGPLVGSEHASLLEPASKVWPAQPPCPRRAPHAGTYGVLTLFGLLPVAMVWSARYGGGGGGGGSAEDSRGGASSRGGEGSQVELVPGGKPVLLLIAGAAAAVIANEVFESAQRLL